MTLDEAIAHYEEMSHKTGACQKDDERLFKWLTELKLARESAFSEIGVAARAVSESHDLKAENEKLRTLVLGLIVCANEDGDARECPLYDDGKPFRCGKDSLMLELGIEA